MILTDYFESEKSLQWDYARQVGISHAVIRLPEDGAFDPADAGHWKTLCGRFESAGLRPVVVEPMPNFLHDHIKAGDAKRDESIEKVLGMFAAMDRVGVRTVCMNFMAYIGWCRTSSTIPERGGALVTGFDIDDFQGEGTPHISEEQLWENLRYFLEAAVPCAEKHGIRLALHPDDPPVSPLGNVSRILISRDNIDRAVHLVPSDSVGVTLCQATYAAMGENVFDVIRYFCGMDKVFFVHFRDIAGSRTHFRETFHDNGQTDMALAVRTYRDCGYDGPIRVDHVPTMAGEENQKPGYASVGRLFAIGYLKGLLDASGYPYR